jgi:hypothetical protein
MFKRSIVITFFLAFLLMEFGKGAEQVNYLKKCSMFNVQLSVVIGGGASRNLFSRCRAEGAPETDN